MYQWFAKCPMSHAWCKKITVFDSTILFSGYKIINSKSDAKKIPRKETLKYICLIKKLMKKLCYLLKVLFKEIIIHLFWNISLLLLTFIALKISLHFVQTLIRWMTRWLTLNFLLMLRQSPVTASVKYVIKLKKNYVLSNY